MAGDSKTWLGRWFNKNKNQDTQSELPQVEDASSSSVSASELQGVDVSEHQVNDESAKPHALTPDRPAQAFSPPAKMNSELEVDALKFDTGNSMVNQDINHPALSSEYESSEYDLTESDDSLEDTMPVDPSTELGWFKRIKQGLSKTSAQMGEGMASLFLGRKVIDDTLLEDIETRLLMADVGIEATQSIVTELSKRVARKELSDSQALYQALQELLYEILIAVEKPFDWSDVKKPVVILVVGVNGVGKTTTIGKLAHHFRSQGLKVMLAAGDTFRAAAVEQLQVWGERNQIPVIAQHTGSDSASVIFDAYQAAQSRGMDVLLADTAGRLHTKDNLMEELKKVKRVLGKIHPDAPHETCLVLDASTGQNAINQATIFNEVIPLTTIILTKLDGTAKGGVIFALAKKLGIAIRFIGVGEALEDLRPFNARQFVMALFKQETPKNVASLGANDDSV